MAEQPVYQPGLTYICVKDCGSQVTVNSFAKGGPITCCGEPMKRGRVISATPRQPGQGTNNPTSAYRLLASSPEMDSLLHRYQERLVLLSFVWNGFRGRDATGTGHEGIVSECSYQGCRRGNPQSIFSQEAMPEGLNRMPLGATPNGANEGSKKWSIIEGFKEGLEFRDDGRFLNNRPGGCNIIIDHWEEVSFLAGLGVGGVTSTFGSVLFSLLTYRTNVSHPDRNVKRFGYDSEN